MNYNDETSFTDLLIDKVRQKGEGEDKILTHLSPQAAQLLNQLYGGDINPVTGLPQYGRFWRNLGRIGKKVVKKVAPIAGIVAGSALLPGGGGAIIGGALGKGLTSRKPRLRQFLKGAALGAAAPYVASSVAKVLPAGAINEKLTDFGSKNQVFKHLLKTKKQKNIGKLLKDTAILKNIANKPLPPEVMPQDYEDYDNVHAKYDGLLPAPASGDDELNHGYSEDIGFLGNLANKSKKYLSDPANLLHLGLTGAAILGNRAPKQPKQQTALEKAIERKKIDQILRLTPEEEEEEFQRERRRKAVEVEEELKKRKKLLEFTRAHELTFDDLEPIRAYHRPDNITGRQIMYRDSQNRPISFAKGGNVKRKKPLHSKGIVHAVIMKNEDSLPIHDGVLPFMPDIQSIMSKFILPDHHKDLEDITHRHGSRRSSPIRDDREDSMYLDGETMGQDDDVPAILSDGEFVIPADVVSHLGDGNNKAGAKKLQDMIVNIRRDKGAGDELPDPIKNIQEYIDY